MAGICLKGIGDFRGNSRAAAERLQGTVKAIRGRLVAVGNAVGAGAGGWQYLQGGVRAGVLEGGIPPPAPLISYELWCRRRRKFF